MTKRRLPAVALLWAVLLGAPGVVAAEPLRLELDATAGSLPEGDIRMAIEKELGRSVTGAEPGAPSDVNVAVVDQRIVIRVRQGDAVVERSVPLPANLADVPLTVSLIVGNLARDQSVGLAAPTAAPPSAPPPPEPAKPEPPPSAAPVPERPRADARRYRSHWLGAHVAQDLAFVGGNNVCDPTLGQLDDNFACFESGTTNRPFFHTPFPLRDEVKRGLVVATTRVLLSYQYAPSPWISIGGRAGYALRGGPPAGQAPDESGVGQGGTPFLPVHLEVDFRAWFAPLTNERVRAYAELSAGLAQVDSKVTVDEYDCTQAGGSGVDPSQSLDYVNPVTGRTYTPFEQCKAAIGHYDYRLYEPTAVDAWKKQGQAFLSLGAGGMVAITDQLGVVLNLKAMVMLPASGLVLEPSLGLELGL